ncbi:type IV secretion system protein [Sphingomonas oryzagri]
MRLRFRVAIAATTLWLATPASAQGIPVYDGQSYLQLVAQLTNAGKQLTQLEQTYSQLQSTYNSFSKITNVASVASLLNNSAVRNLLPPEVSSMATLLSGNPSSTGAIGTLAKQFQQQYALPASSGSTSADGAYASYLNAVNGGAANMMALGSNTLAIGNQRTTGLTDLQNQISSAKDPKDAMDLNVRATVENAQATNDLIKLQAIQLSQQAQSDLLLKQYWASRSRSANAVEYQAVSALTAQ